MSVKDLKPGKIRKQKNLSALQDTMGDKIFGAVNIILLLIITFVLLYPIYFIVIASLSDPFDVVNGRVFLWIKNFTLESYGYVIKQSNLWTGYRNTIINTVCTVAYQLVLLVPAAYVLSKKNLAGRKFFNWFFVITMFFGGGMVPTYLMYKDFGLLNTRWSLILSAVGTYNMIVTRTYFQNSIPQELYEAAHIDGASEFSCFFRIALPLSGAIVSVIALFVASGSWNSYYNAMLYIRTQKLYPLQLVLRDTLITAQNAYLSIDPNSADEDAFAQALRLNYLAESMKYSVIFVASFPMLALYPFVQRFFVKGVMIGAVKG